MSRHLSSVLRGGFVLVVVVAGLVVSACGDLPPPEGAVAVPCGGDEATTFELGPAGKLGGRYGQFSTTGATVWVTAAGLPNGPIFEIDRTGIEVGWASEPPEYDEVRGGEATNILTNVSVQDGLWSPMELQTGDYWLWSTAGGEVTIQTCTAGTISDPVPAPPATFAARPGG